MDRNEPKFTLYQIHDILFVMFRYLEWHERLGLRRVCSMWNAVLKNQMWTIPKLDVKKSIERNERQPSDNVRYVVDRTDLIGGITADGFSDCDDPRTTVLINTTRLVLKLGQALKSFRLTNIRKGTENIISIRTIPTMEVIFIHNVMIQLELNCAEMVDLQTLHIENSKPTKVSDIPFDRLHKLRHLSVDSDSCGIKLEQTVQDAMQVMTALDHLEVGIARLKCYAILEQVAVTHSQQIKSLRFHNMSAIISQTDVDNFRRNICRFDLLETLRIWCCESWLVVDLIIFDGLHNLQYILLGRTRGAELGNLLLTRLQRDQYQRRLRLLPIYISEPSHLMSADNEMVFYSNGSLSPEVVNDALKDEFNISLDYLYQELGRP